MGGYATILVCPLAYAGGHAGGQRCPFVYIRGYSGMIRGIGCRDALYDSRSSPIDTLFDTESELIGYITQVSQVTISHLPGCIIIEKEFGLWFFRLAFLSKV